MIFPCSICGEEKSYIKKYKSTFNIKNKKITVNMNRRFCCKCNNLRYDHELDDAYLKKAYKEYNKKYGLPKEDIIKIRKDLKLSQEDFSKIIGCAKKTLVSYENGNSIPNDIYLITIKTIIDNPNVIKNMIKANKERYSTKEYNKINKRINEAFSNNYSNFLERREGELTELNGYTNFSITKLINLIKILSKERINKTKLLKEMFYVDFRSYYEYCCSITGLEYTKYPFGPVPDDFENILQELTKRGEISYIINYKGDYEEHIIINNSHIDVNVFMKEELDIINKVINKFKNYSVKDIVEYSHSEIAYKETELRKKISYEYALDLKEF